MVNWYAPCGPKEWLLRTCSVLNLGILAFTVALVVSEFRFDWCETLAGRYLLTTNARRPETGKIWEAGHHTLNARQSINDLILEKENEQQLVRAASSFAELAQSLGEGRWANLDKDQFKQLYLAISPDTRTRLIDPVRLVWLLNGGGTSRIFCEGHTAGMTLYFIGSDNRVIHQLTIDKASMQSGGQADTLQGSLETMDGFSGVIYPAGQFFEAVFKLPRQMVQDLLPQVELLLSARGILNRVGIENTVEQGRIRLGFEFNDLGETRVVVVEAREWAVWQLNLVLKGEAL